MQFKLWKVNFEYIKNIKKVYEDSIISYFEILRESKYNY